ncbi:MAG: Na/Pi cotransporter family protein [Clostridia bacterium]|nr:Na/Pi cotransporter family protein [Clostridia bacterium]
MDFFSVLTLFGGLAMFLYGMDIMGEGLKKLSGSKLEMILEKLTANKFLGFLLGAGVTAVIQSSGATTVMLVGFVNSGIMKLSQTISIIMGANLGTTVTAWILSLSGINGESFFLRLLKPSSFTPVLAMIGIILSFTAKRDKQKDIGSILLGFSVLMFGMETMSSSMSGLKDSPLFARLLGMFSNPVTGILAGFLLTAVIQSSSAAVGVLQAISITGAINFSEALPLILGANVGAALTPMLSAINGNTNAKRVAAACIHIKLISVAVLAGIFYIANSIFGFSIMSDTVGAVYIAIIHTVFNLTATVILLPFSDKFEKLAKNSVKDKKDKKAADVFDTLDERFLLIPGYAVEKCNELVRQMAEISKTMVLMSLGLMYEYDEKSAAEIEENEELVDTYEDKISTYLVHLALGKLSERDSKTVTHLLHVVGDLERISDHAVNIVSTAREISKKNIQFSKDAEKEINVMFDAICEILKITVNALCTDDRELAKRVEPLEQTIDNLKRIIKDNHINRLRDGLCTIEFGFVLSDIITNCERVADHCSNIAVSILEQKHNSLETHEYLNQVKNEGRNKFFELYNEYSNKYVI